MGIPAYSNISKDASMIIYSTNLIFYVYAYLRKDGTPYYIGKGKNKRIIKKGKNDSIHPPKNNSQIIFIEKNLTEIGALALERRMIRWYGRIDLKTGILRNKTDGGDGTCGYKHSTKSRKNRSNSMLGKKHPERGEKISLSNKGRVLPKRTVQHRKNLSISLTGRTQQRIDCPYCSKSGGITNIKRYHFENCKFKPTKNIETINTVIAFNA
jgi:hypothetical protein